MNQTAWIMGGGAVAVLIAVLLYMYTGDGLASIPVPKTVSPTIALTDTAQLSATVTPVLITQKPTPKMEPRTTEETHVILHTTLGDITLKLYTQDSPKTVDNFVKLARSGFYDGVKFHRVIKDFMVQTGDPLSKEDSKMGSWGTGGPGYVFADEFNQHKLVRGSLAMANSGPNTNGSQFFIVTSEATPWLDGKHTNFGEVTDGLPVLMKIDATPTTGGDRPVTPVIMTSVEVR